MSLFMMSFFTIMVAEMGDKTQLMAMAMTQKFKWQSVLGGILISTLLLSGMAVLLGQKLAFWLPMERIKGVAGCLFLLFALWSLLGEKGEETGENACGCSPALTVGLTFFLAELGDKTQLYTLALAAAHPHDGMMIFLATTLGLFLADCLGIAFGLFLGKNIPRALFQGISYFVFAIFGGITVWPLLPNHNMALLLFSLFFMATALILMRKKTAI